MECLYCKKELLLPYNSQRSMDNYNNPCLTVTNCCGELVHVVPLISYKVIKYFGDRTEDDWGREGKFAKIVKKLKGENK